MSTGRDPAPSVRLLPALSEPGSRHAVKRLREKLEEDPSHPELLRSTRGVGLWLARQPAPVATSRPVDQQRYVPRVELEDRLCALLDGEARVITLAGAHGIGKSRTAAEVLGRREPPPVVVQGTRAVDADELFHRVATAAGVLSGDQTGLTRRLAERCVWLDGIDADDPNVDRVLDALPSTRFVVTSLRPLGRSDEAVLPMAGLTGEAARAFVRQCLARSPMAPTVPWSDDDVDRIHEGLDGVPEAIQVTLADPRSVAALQRGDDATDVLLRRPSRLIDAWRATLATLPPEAADLLARLANARHPLTDDELDAWLGPDAFAPFPELVSRHLLRWEGEGWQVPSLVRAAVDGGTDPTLEAFLVGHAWRLGEQLLHQANHSGSRLATLAPALIECMESGPPDDTLAIGVALFRLYDLRGPQRAQRDVVDRLSRRLPQHPLVQAMEFVVGRRPFGQLAGWAEGIADTEPLAPRFEAMLIEILAELVPHLVRPARIRALVDEPSLPEAIRLDLTRMAIQVEAAHGLTDAIPAFEDLWRRVTHLPGAEGTLLCRLGEAYRTTGRAVDAAHVLQRSAGLRTTQGLPRAEVTTLQILALALRDDDLRAGARAHLDNARRLEALGESPHRELVRAGQALYAAGELEEAAPLLAEAHRVADPQDRAIGRLLAMLIELRQGSQQAEQRLGHVDEDVVPGHRPDGTPVGMGFGAVARAEVALQTHTWSDEAEAALRQAVDDSGHRLEARLLADLLRRAR